MWYIGTCFPPFAWDELCVELTHNKDPFAARFVNIEDRFVCQNTEYCLNLANDSELKWKRFDKNNLESTNNCKVWLIDNPCILQPILK